MTICTDVPHRPRSGAGGFTLVEVLLALGITATIMAVVSGTLVSILQAREEVVALRDSTEAGPRTLALIERDLRGLWHHNIGDNKIFVGRDMDAGGPSADRMDFLTTTDAIGLVVDTGGFPRRATVCEVGYWLKRSEIDDRVLELWRREDPYVDDDRLTGGTFQLVHDRVLSFNVTYYETLGVKAEELHEWDSSREDSLPRRLKIELEIEIPKASRNRVFGNEIERIEESKRTYVRHIVFDRRYPEILKPNIAMVPVLPPRPDVMLSEQGGGPGGGAAGGGISRATNSGLSDVKDAGNTRADVVTGRDSGRGNRGTRGDRGANPGRGAPPPGGFDLGDLFRGGNRGGLGIFGGGR